MTLRKQLQDKIKSGTSSFKEVSGAASLAAVLAGRVNPNSCYLFKDKKTTTESSMINIVNQRVTEQIAIVIVVRNVTDQKGEDASDISEGLQDEIQAKLLGWTPEGYEPLEHSGGSLVSLTNGFYIWKESYKTSHYIRG